MTITRRKILGDVDKITPSFNTVRGHQQTTAHSIKITEGGRKGKRRRRRERERVGVFSPVNR